MKNKTIICILLGLLYLNTQAQQITQKVSVGIGAVTVSSLNTSNIYIMPGDKVSAYNKPSIIVGYGINMAHEKFSYGISTQLQ